jgi:heme iron utilization protein
MTDETPAKTVRGLGRRALQATLATLDRSGGPYASLVLVATDSAGAAVLLISELAVHTRNLKGDARASILFDGTAGYTEPLTGPRASVMGPFERCEDESAMRRFLARHPSAEQYAGFRDFAFYRQRPEHAHLVAGFGRIQDVAGADLQVAVAELSAAEPDILAHMNEDHAEAIGLYATKLLGQPAGRWRMIALDPEGCDLRLGGQTARLDFARTLANAEEARAELVRLANAARAT